MSNDIFPMKVYGSDISYFTGKLEMYLRAKGIAYEYIPMAGEYSMDNMVKLIGVNQMPAATLADGRWMTDTTPMIAWLEEQQPSPPIVPSDPEQRFFCLLLEDYADEWLWRPAMHFRWYPAEGAMFASRHLAAELGTGVRAPGFLKRMILRRRQRGGYTVGDGVCEQNRVQVEQTYFSNLEWLNAILSKRRFLLGDSPSLADIGFMGPFFRHFGLDPVPLEIMRLRAPAVWAWVARMWNVQPQEVSGSWLTGIPDDWGPILDDIGGTYLPYLNENAKAVKAGKTRADLKAAGVTYPNARVAPYRIWCLEKLREHYNALPGSDAARVKQRLEQHGCWQPLWEIEELNSGVNKNLTAPFGTDAKMVGP